jgi:hypothetical protein
MGSAGWFVHSIGNSSSFMGTGDFAMSMNYPLNPRVRAYGKARLDFAQRVKNPADWEKLWIPSSNTFPFDWGESWKKYLAK